MEENIKDHILRMDRCYQTAYNVINGLLEVPLETLSEKDIEHLEATKKVLGIISDVYTDIVITTIPLVEEAEKKEG